MTMANIEVLKTERLIFSFRSQKDSSVFGFTNQREGGNLPMDFAPWRALGEQVIQAGEPLGGVSGGTTAVLAGIAQDGYFLTKPEIRIFRKTLARQAP
jgi:hypothetical protein